MADRACGVMRILDETEHAGDVTRYRVEPPLCLFPRGPDGEPALLAHAVLCDRHAECFALAHFRLVEAPAD